MSRTSFLSPFARTTTRLVAGVSALLLAITGLTVLTATAAYAATSSVSGHAYLGTVPVTDDDDYEPVGGVTVALLPRDGGESGAATDTTTTASDGSFTLTAPTDTQDQIETWYRVRFTFPDSTVVYYDHEHRFPNAFVSSTPEWDEATAIRPLDWDGDDIDALATSAPPPTETDEERLCDNEASEDIDFETSTVWWEEICETDSSIHDAGTGATAEHDDAFDDFGYVWFDQPTDYYEVTADDYETTVTDGMLTTVLHDDEIYLAEAGLTVDVTVTRTFAGSFVRWVVEVRDAETGELADVPFFFSGVLGSEDDTVWTGSGNWRVSDDDSTAFVDRSDPVLAHHVEAANFDWDTEDEYPRMELEVEDGGQLTYTLAVIDYAGCIGDALRTAAGGVAQAMPGNFGTDLTPFIGAACTTNWDPVPAVGELKVGVAFDQTFDVNSPLDWEDGGSAGVYGLPSGLSYQILDEYEDDTAPRLRIYGTPEAEGVYDLYFFAHGYSSQDNEDAVEVTIVILPGDGPSATYEARICDEGYSGARWRDFETGSVYWDYACLTDPTIYSAVPTAYGLEGAFEEFGYLWIDQGGFDYYVTADSYTSSVEGGVFTTVIHDDDVVLADDSTVDVTVVRTIEGSFVRWDIEVRDSVTGDIVDVPFFFGGDLDSGGDTVWTGSGSRRTSDDQFDDKPILAHYAVGDATDSVTWSDEDGEPLGDGDDELILEVDGGRLTYIAAVIDYWFCDDVTLRDSSTAIVQAMPGNFGQDLSIVEGCDTGWPPPTLHEMRVGTPFEQTLTVESPTLDWEVGGEVHLEGLPDGLDWEALHSWEDGVAPQVRIFGTPTTVGAYRILFGAVDGWDGDGVRLTGTVLGPVQSSDIHLNFGLGDQVGGGTADVTGTGLKAGSSFSVVVQSTPQTIGSGTIGADFLLDSTVTFPTNLGAGWHTITLSGTFFDGTTLTDRLWIKVGADGTLLAISTTAPAAEPGLAATGADAVGGVALALALLLLGGLVLLLWRRRTGPAQ